MNKEHDLPRNTALRELGVRYIWVVALFVFLVAAIVAWSLLPPPLPKVVRFGTGPADSYYAGFGEALRKEVADHNVDLETVTTAGSMENIRQLLDGDIDVGLVQGGNLSDDQAAQLVSIASVFYELVLVVERAEWEHDHLYKKGGSVAIGAPGSGGHALASQLFADQGVSDGIPPGVRFVELGGQRAVEAILKGEVDSGVIVTPIDTPEARALFADPGVRVVNLALAEAFTRHYRYLRRIVVPAGLTDLRLELPSNDVQVIATTASLVIRPDAHRALIPLLIESARAQLQQGSLLAAPGEFPSAHGVEAPLADEARQYFERGPSFFYRWLPFRYASTATRLTIILIPLLTLLYPLFRLAGPAYKLINRRRVYRWYRVLQRIEKRMETSRDAASLQRVHQELERVGERIRHTHVPASYGADLFGLQVHHRLLADRLDVLKQNNP